MQHNKVVVTGGAGFIGANLIRTLLEEGKDVHVVDTFVGGRFPERLPVEATVHEVDIRDTSKLLPVFEGADVIYHLAALPRVQDSIEQPVETHDVNVNGTLSVLEAAREKGVRRVVFASSAAIYGDQENVPLTEDAAPEPKSPYGLHKYLCEEMLRLWASLYRVETVSLRFFNVYGPYLDPQGAYALVVGKFLEQHKRGEPLTIVGDGTHTRDYVHVADIARALIMAATSSEVGEGEVLNVGSGTETSVNDLAKLFGGDTTYIEPRIEPSRSCASIKRTQKLLDWKPTIPLADGIKSLLEG
jgi:UDP-glucose 4-epimerase